MSTQGAHELDLAGQSILLDPRRAMVWPSAQTLIIADPHIGKDDTFRRAGIPVPASVAQADFDRLSELLRDYRPQRLIVLGDFLHARPDMHDHCIACMREWRGTFSQLDVTIVRGNHDDHAGPPPGELGLRSVDEPFEDGPFIYRHFPIAQGPVDGGAFVLAGHLHPGVTVALGGGSARRVPCFAVNPWQMILPAFGRFTGTGRVDRRAGAEVYAVGRDRVIPLPPLARV